MGRTYTDAQAKAIVNYREKHNVKDIKIRVSEEKREEYKRFAESKGMSLNQLMIELIEEEISKSKE